MTDSRALEQRKPKILFKKIGSFFSRITAISNFHINRYMSISVRSSSRGIKSFLKLILKLPLDFTLLAFGCVGF